MKYLLNLLLFLTIVSNVFSQVQKDTVSYAFPIGSRFTLELIPVDSINYKYHVLNSEKFDLCMRFSNAKNHLSKEPISGTIECIFAKGEEADQSILILRNNSKVSIDYKAMISYDYTGRFYETSVYPLLPNVSSIEIWNNKLTNIFINNISKLSFVE